MRRLLTTTATTLTALGIAGEASGQEPSLLPPSYAAVLQEAKQPADPKQPDPKQPGVKPADQVPPKQPAPPSPIERAFASPFARGVEAGGFAAKSFNPNFDGDFLGVSYARQVITGVDRVNRVVGFNQQLVGANQRQTGTTPRVIGTTQTIVFDPPNNTPRVVTTPVVVQDPVFVLDPVVATSPITVEELVQRRQVVRLPAAARYNGVMITENDNPRPTDRVYAGYNFYSDVGASLNPALGGADVQRQTAGFELTFLDGDASIGMRIPYVQQYGPAGLGSQTVGDLSVIFKYAFYNDLETGDLASAGVVITAPTGGGSGIVLADGSNLPHSTLFQPWVGFVRMYDSGFVQGISNLIVPSDSRDPTLWGNSLSAGVFLYADPTAPVLTAVTPKVEVHVRTPLNQRDPNGLVYLQDQVNVTTGFNFGIRRATLSTAVSVPLVGPRPFGVEAISYLNFNF